MTDLAARLRLAREIRGMSRADLSRLSGVSARDLKAHELGARRPSAASLARLSGALGVSVDWLLGLVDEHHAHASAERLVPGLSRLDARDLEVVGELVARFPAT